MLADRSWRGTPVGDLVDHALAAQERGVRTGSVADLEAAVDVYRRLEVGGALSDQEIWDVRTNLGECLRMIGKLTGDRLRLYSAAAYAQLLSREPAPSPAARRQALLLFALTLSSRYEVLGAEPDADRALAVVRDVLDEPSGRWDPHRYMAINLAANLLGGRFVRHSRIEDLEETARLRRDALAALEELRLPEAIATDQRTGLRYGLGSALLQRYHLRGDPRDLREAVDTLAAVVLSTSENDAAAPGFRAALADGLLAMVALYFEQESSAEGHAAALDLVDDSIGLLALEPLPDQRGSLLARVRAQSLVESWQWRYALTRDQVDFDRAIEAIERALAERGSDRGGDLLLRRAELFRTRHDVTGSPDHLERAVACYEEACAASVATANGVRDAGNWGDWALRRESWEEAARAYGHALRALRSRHEQQSLERHKQEWLRESQFIPAHAAYSLVRCGRPDQAAAAAEQGRALLLAEVLQRDTADLGLLRERGRGDLADRFEAARAQLAALRTLPAPDTDQESRAQKALSAAVEAIRGAGHPDFLLLPGTEPVREALPDAQLVYLFSSVAGTGAVIVPPGRAPISSVLLDGVELGALTEKVNDHMLLQQDRGDLDRWQRHLDDLTRWCWIHVMGPLLEALPPGGPCVLVPSGPLAFLPLHAAWEPDPNRPSGRRHALDVVPFGYAPSATTLRAAAKRRGPGAGDGVLPGSALGVHDPADGLAPLPFAALEIEALQAALPVESDRLTGARASRAAVLARLSEAGLVHFACHATARLDDPLSSCLFLADGPLTVRELGRQAGSAAQLAILSGCETGLVGTALPDEAVGLPAGFLQAGFATVIASLWAVPDIATALLMTRFYQFCTQDRLGPAEALCQAQRWVRDATNDEKAAILPAYGQAVEGLSPVLRRLWGTARAHTSPYYWAAFTCNGSG